MRTRTEPETRTFEPCTALKDDAAILINAQPRMTSGAEIKPTVVKRYLKEAKTNAEHP